MGKSKNSSLHFIRHFASTEYLTMIKWKYDIRFVYREKIYSKICRKTSVCIFQNIFLFVWISTILKSQILRSTKQFCCHGLNYYRFLLLSANFCWKYFVFVWKHTRMKIMIMIFFIKFLHQLFNNILFWLDIDTMSLINCQKMLNDGWFGCLNSFKFTERTHISKKSCCPRIFK